VAELVFPLVATFALVLFVIPLATVVSKMLLVALRRSAARTDGGGVDPHARGVREAGSTLRYLLLVAPVSVPAVWLASAAVHHAEAERAALACVIDHVSDGACSEPLMIATVIALALGSTFLWRRHVATAAVAERHLACDPVAERRLDAACVGHVRLLEQRHRIRVVEGRDVRTVGLFRPHVEVGAELVRSLDERALVGALLHEDEHVRGCDPLRFVVLSACQNLNPASALLADELWHWRRGREALCDEAAVHRGADPCSLAEALVAVARPPAALGAGVAHLGRGGGIELLRVRVTLLMDYATSPPRCRCASPAPKLAVLALVTLAVLPHYLGERVLVDLHQGTERVVFEALTDV